MLGGPGNDVLVAWDGQRDIIDGGPCRDRVSIGKKLDRVLSVEQKQSAPASGRAVDAEPDSLPGSYAASLAVVPQS